MITAGIKEVKNNLSRLLARVKSGEEIVITERGRPIARIARENSTQKSIRVALAPLIRRGMIALPGKNISKDGLMPVEISGKPPSEIVIADRR